jgi:hypothetical protein
VSLPHVVAAVALSVVVWLSAGAAEVVSKTCDLSEPETGTVAAVLDGETLHSATAGPSG